MKFLIILIIPFFLISCEDDSHTIPDGFIHVSKDSASHFVYVEKEYLGDNINQRETGRKICNDIYKQIDYCEVYFFDDLKLIPKKFPIMNRLKPIGRFDLKNGKEKFKVLKEWNPDKIKYN